MKLFKYTLVHSVCTAIADTYQHREAFPHLLQFIQPRFLEGEMGV